MKKTFSIIAIAIVVVGLFVACEPEDTTIKFHIGSTPYSCDKGMTWGAFVTTTGASALFEVDAQNRIKEKDGDSYVLHRISEPVYSTETIVDGTNYLLVNEDGACL